MNALPLPTAAVRIAADLDALERQMNETLRAAAQLQKSMMDYRIDGDVAPYEGQIAVSRVQNATTKIVEGQSEIAKAHKSLRTDFTRMADVPDVIGQCPVAALGQQKEVA